MPSTSFSLSGPPMADVEIKADDAHGPRTDEEVLLAVALTTQHMLLTGRYLGIRPVLHHLGPAELVEFWAEDHLSGVPSARPK